jgi:hypothetical protein
VLNSTGDLLGEEAEEDDADDEEKGDDIQNDGMIKVDPVEDIQKTSKI